MDKSLFFSLFLSGLIILFTIGLIEYRPIRSLISPVLGEVDIIKSVENIKKGEHVRGNLSSGIFIVEYSDFTCLFCKEIRSTLKRFEKNYPNVGFVYRHFYPIERSGAISRAVTSECVAMVAGEDMFWTYINNLYEKQAELDDGDEVDLAIQLGVDVVGLENCLLKNSDKISKKIREDTQEVRKIGAIGTPYILVVKDGLVVRAMYGFGYDQFVSNVLDAIE